jgi:hypothetical protein
MYCPCVLGGSGVGPIYLLTFYEPRANPARQMRAPPRGRELAPAPSDLTDARIAVTSLFAAISQGARRRGSPGFVVSHVVFLVSAIKTHEYYLLLRPKVKKTID